MNKIVCVPVKSQYSIDATIKPRKDMGVFLKDVGFETIETKMFQNQALNDTNKKLLDHLAKEHYKENEVNILWYQYPTYMGKDYEIYFLNAFKAQGFIVVGFVHDIDYLRGMNDDFAPDKEILSNFNYLLVASNKIKQFLTDNGVTQPRLLLYPMFDYYSLAIEPVYFNSGEVINYSGNLMKAKAGFLVPFSKAIKDTDLRLNVYGTKPKDDLGECYKGPIDPDVMQYEDGWGLIWDGDENEKGAYQSYLEYNWSYKLSAYLRNGLPVIAKKGSNVGNFVEQAQVGIVLNDLDELVPMIDALLDKDRELFDLLCINAQAFSYKLARGYYTKSLAYKTMTYIQDNNKVV